MIWSSRLWPYNDEHLAIHVKGSFEGIMGNLFQSWEQPVPKFLPPWPGLRLMVETCHKKVLLSVLVVLFVSLTNFSEEAPKSEGKRLRCKKCLKLKTFSTTKNFPACFWGRIGKQTMASSPIHVSVLEEEKNNWRLERNSTSAFQATFKGLAPL